MRRSAGYASLQRPDEQRLCGYTRHPGEILQLPDRGPLASDMRAFMLHKKDFERHLISVFGLILSKDPRDSVRELCEEIVERRILKSKPGDVCRSNEPDSSRSISPDNDLVFHVIFSVGEPTA